MTQDVDTSDMRLTSVLRDWMEKREWEDEIDINGDRDFAEVIAWYVMGGQKHPLHLEANELKECFDIYLYTPFNVPPARMADMSRLLNRINLCIGIGRLCCLDEGLTNPVQYKVGIDVEGAPFAPQHIENMLAAGGRILDHYGQLLATVALTDVSADAAWSKFLEEEERKEDSVGLSGSNVVPFKRV